MTRRRPLAWLTSLVALLAAGASGCGDGVTPELRDLRFDGQAADSPLVLLLSVDFVDGDADLAGGQLDTFINQRATSAGPLELLPLFVASDVDLDAAEGTIEFVLELSFTDEAPASGTTFALGARVKDEAKRASDVEEIKLRLDTL